MSLRELVFQPDNPCNTTIVDAQDPDEVYYRVHTEHEGGTTTYVKGPDNEHIASWVWKDARSDVITFGKTKPLPASTWLRKSMVPFVSDHSFKGPNGKSYKWKKCDPGPLPVELYIEGDSHNPVAQYRRGHKYTKKDVEPHAEVFVPTKLTLDPRGQEVQELAVISFLLIERRRRESDYSRTNMADSVAASAHWQLPG